MSIEIIRTPQNSPNIICERCAFGHHEAKMCYKGGWDYCKGSHFKSTREVELEKELKKTQTELEELKHRMDGLDK